MNLDQSLLDILACPACRAPLQLGTPEDPAADRLTCTGCGLRYPVRDDIPVLLVDEAEKPA